MAWVANDNADFIALIDEAFAALENGVSR
jgi:hypothetical protein